MVLPSQSSLATAVYTLSEPAASGLPLTLLIEEELTLLDNSVRRQTPYQADLILYHAPDGPPRSRFQLRPSASAQTLPLKLGAEDVTLRTYGGEAVSGNVVGPEGGTVTGADGDRIDLPAGAVTEPTAIVLTRKAAADLGLPVPAGTALDGVLHLDLNGQRLLVPGALSLALNPAPAAGDKGLLLQVIELESGRAFRAVAALQATATGWTTAAIDPQDLAWPGVREEGLYAFVRLTGAFGSLRGTVSDVGGLPLAGAVVRATGVTWVQLSNAGGTYALPVAAGTVTATAENRLTGNQGSAQAEVVVDARVDLNLSLQPVGPRVVQITPADGAVDVIQGVQPTVRFSEPVAPASVTGAIQLLSEGQPVAVDLEVQGALVRVKPRSALLPATAHELRVTSGVRDLQGNSLESPEASQFTTLRVLLTNDIDLTRVFLVEPGANGQARVLGKPGAVPAGALVFVENRNALVTTPSATAGQDGGFDLNIEATFAHTLILHVLIPGSNEIVAKLTPFHTPDLKGAYVDDKAVIYTTGDGVKVMIAEGTFTGPAVVRLEPKPLTELAAPVPSGFAAVYNFSLDFSGAQARKALQISVPKPAGAPEAVEGVYLLNRAIEALGKRYWMMHDIMRLDAATGRLTTELPAAGTAAAGVQEAAVVASLADPFMLAAAQTTEPPVYTAKSIVRQYKSYVTGSAFPGQYQVAASQIPLGFTIFPSFDMNFQVGIWNLGMEGMATRIDAGIAQLLEGDGIMIPTRRHQPYKLVVRDLTTGFRLYENTFAAPTSDEPISLPPDVYGDTVPPAPAGGTPVRFIPLNFSGPSELQIDLGIKAQWANDKITITGEVDSTQSEVEIRLIGLDDNASVTATSNATGAFTLESPGKIGKRYLLAIGARIPSDRPLEINFSEALSEDFAGIEVVDASGNMLHPAKVPVGTRATVQVSLRSGWRADKEYTLRLDDQLADGSGNTWDHLLEVQFEVFGSDTLGTFQIPAVRDIARLGSWLFVAADSTGLLVMDASDPAHLRNVLPNNLGFPFPLADPVRGVAVDPHGRVLVAGGGVTGPGQLKIFDPLAMDIQAITEHPNDVSLRFAAFKGSTIISDKLGGTGTQLPSGTPRRVAILSNDKTNEWKLGDPAPADLQVTPTENPGGVDDDFEVTVTGTDGTAGRPVMLQDLTRGRWHRIDAGANGHYTIKLQVQEGDRLRLLRNQDSIAYVATTGVGLEVVDVNAFYNEDHNFVHSDIRGTYSGFKENLTLCGQPVADIGTAFTDLDTLFDPANLNPVVVVGLVGQRGFLLLRSNPASVGEVSLLNQECTDVEGSTAISALAVLQHYIFDLDGDGELESTEGRDYILVAHQKGGILIYDVTDREEIRLVGRIRMPGQVSQLSVDREGRRLYVAGAAAGFYIVDLDAPPSKDLLDVDHDGKDDRILETIALPGNTNTNVRLVPELGLAFAGGLNRGLTSLAVGHPQLDVLARGSDGRYRKINRVAPFGVPTAKESSDPESPDIPGSFRLLASLPGLVGDQVKLDVTGGLGPAALGETACLLGEEPEIVLHRMANKPWEPGYQLYLSNQIAVLADPRASRRYQRTPKETEECVRCDLDEEEVPEDAVEVMSGDFVNVMFPQELREQLLDVYSKDRIDASELRLSSVRWDLVPPVEQEPAQNPCLVAEAPGLLGCTGEMTHSTTDLGVRGLGFDFVLRRFYRSQSIGMGPFGPGWDHNYNQRLRKLPNGDVEYYDGMGRRETFTVQEGGTLKSPPGRFASLEHVSSGWIMLDAQHNATRFDEYGRLTSIADAVKDSKDTGNEMTFFYDAKSRLVRVKDTTDRDILFEYREQACGEISKITDFDGREFLYEYDDKNRLVNFKTPIVPTVLAVGDPTSLQTEPLETRYTYDEGSGNLADVLNGQDNLTSVKDPKGQSWLNVSYGDTNGDQRQNEVAGQSWGGGNIQVQYDFGGHQATLTDPRGQQFSYTFSEKGQVKEIRDPAGASATFTYDDEGLVATRTDPNGRVTTYAYDAPCANPPIGERRSRGNLTSISVTPDDHGPNGSSSPLVTCTDYEGYSNQPVQIVDPRGTVTLVSRNEVGLPIAITQAAGTPDASTVQTSYNERGQPLLSVNPNGNTIQYLYNRLGYPAGMVADSHGLALVTRFETDQRGNVIAMIDPRGVGFTRAYNALNWIVETHRAVTGAADVEGAPALNYTTTYLHDANGNVIEERLPYGDGSAITRRAYIYGPVDELLQSFAQETPGQPFLEWPTTFRFYDSNRNLVKIVEPAGQVTEFTYDSRNILSSVIRGAGTEDAVTEHHAYDLEGKKISYQDGRGGTWTTAYDGYGRVSRTVDAVGNIATVSYDNGSNPITTGVYQGPVQAGDDPVLMAQKGAQYDRLNRPKAITQKLWEYGSNTEPRDLTSRFEYDAASNLKKITDPLNRIATSEYDHAERLVATVDPMGNRLERDLDKAGNPLTTRSIEVQPAGAGAVTVTTQATYDALGRLSTATDALGNVNKLFYDARNNLRISIDPESFVTERTYDGLDRLTRQIQPEGISVDYGYDKSSRLVSYQDALSQKTTYSYDVLNRRTGVTYPDGKHESYRYDASHNPRQITDANGSTIQQTFDAANRLTGRSVGLGSGVIGTTSEVYTYDALNRMTRAQSGTVVTELTFNPLSRMVRERTAGREVTYQYDDVGNPTRLEYPSGFALRQTFDALNRPTTIGQVNGTAPGAPFDEAVSYAYRGQGLVVTKTLGNGLTGNDQYDAVRRLLDETFKTATGQTVFRESLAWTPRSLKVTQSRGDLNGEGFLFGYDGAGRLTQAGKALNPALANNSVAPPQDFANLPDAFGYTYDKAQNLLVRTEKDDGVAKAVALPLDGSGRNRPASVGPVALEWDSNGNMIRKGDLRFQYDYRNRLARVSRANGEEVATYQYDAFNRRIAKVVAGETRETTWRGWQPVEERRNGDLDQRRVYGLGLDEMVQLQVDLNGDGQADQTYAPIYDSMGNLVLMTGNGGKPIERYEYTPYGERKIFVDSTPPAVEQVRVKGSALWIEISEGVASDALAKAVADHTVKLTNIGNGQEIGIATVTQPVTTGRQARRRLVITTTGPPAAETQVRLTIPAVALRDSFLNQPTADYDLTFSWPQSDAVLQDSQAIRLQSAAIRDGHLEIELSEEPDLATASAIQLDGAGATWTLSDDRYSLRSTAELSAGSHAVTIGPGLTDLNGTSLTTALNESFTVAAHGNQAVFEAPDPRESSASTIGNPFGFKGLQIDPETGLIYARNRYYDPEMGRFVTADPSGYADGPNSYQFGLNSPGNYGDPFGLQALPRPNPFPVFPGPANDNFPLGPRPVPPPSVPPTVKPVPVPGPGPLPYLIAFAVGWDKGREFGTSTQDDGRTGDQRIQDDLSDYMAGARTFDEIATDWFTDALLSKGEQKAANQPIQPNPYTPRSGSGAGEQQTPVFNTDGQVERWLPNLRGGTGSGRANKAPLDKAPYTIHFSVQLSPVDYPGVSDERHFQIANEALYKSFQASPEFAQEMEKQYPGIVAGVAPGARGAFPRRAPTPDTTWHHHPTEEGVVELVPRDEHSGPGSQQEALHPDGRGGMENWGGGRKRGGKKNGG
ncbi:MAG TPA: Ig-like domain-containing protein [Thermoanaerobaculia bacterium]|nr:Ig-like domain-containing protein [Thermoanaerobaculia bacterium]